MRKTSGYEPIGDEEHVARVQRTRDSIMDRIKDENPRVAEVVIDEDGTWHAMGKNGQEISRAETGHGLLAIVPYL